MTPAVNTSRPSTTTDSSMMRQTREAVRRSEPSAPAAGRPRASQAMTTQTPKASRARSFSELALPA